MHKTVGEINRKNFQLSKERKKSTNLKNQDRHKYLEFVHFCVSSIARWSSRSDAQRSSENTVSRESEQRETNEQERGISSKKKKRRKSGCVVRSAWSARKERYRRNDRFALKMTSARRWKIIKFSIIIFLSFLFFFFFFFFLKKQRKDLLLRTCWLPEYLRETDEGAQSAAPRVSDEEPALLSDLLPAFAFAFFRRDVRRLSPDWSVHFPNRRVLVNGDRSPIYVDLDSKNFGILRSFRRFENVKLALESRAS